MTTRSAFWEGFLARANERRLLPARFTLKDPLYLNFRTGTAGALWGYQRHQQGTQVNLHFWLRGDREGTLRLYQQVADHQAEIEAALRERLVWKINRAGANVALPITHQPISFDETSPAVFDAMLSGMVRFQRALEPWLAQP